MRASTNPLAYCEGGFYGGHLKPNEKIGKLLKPMTASFGITALNELQELYNGKSIREDGQFALEVLKYINDKVNQSKQEMVTSMQSTAHRLRVSVVCRLSSSARCTES